jgi:NAD(P)-dependent dehydrogenase (short-subunit alcohol dehydrogenase family)
MGTLRFDGQVAVVTGAGNGLGRCYAMYLAEHGAKVVVNDLGRDRRGEGDVESAAQSVADEIIAAGGIAIANANSVASETGAASIVADAVSAWGHIDIVVNNAGVTPNGEGIDQASRDEWNRVVDVHLHGSVNVLRAAWPHMASAGYGRVVNISSSSALGMPFVLTYGTAKAALVGLTRILAVEGEPTGIRVNAVMPTAATRMTATDFAPVYESMYQLQPGEFVQRFPAESVAPGVALLCHESVPCSGETFSIGGGRMARVFTGVTVGVTAEDPADYLADWATVFSPDRFTVATDTWVNEGAHLGADRVTWRTSQET